MKFIEFIFPFLFTRNWVSGQRELSQPRLFLFLAMIFIILLGILLAVILQSPVTYQTV